MKRLLLVCSLMALAFANFAAIPIITVITQKPKGSMVTFQLRTNPASIINIDFGDGTLVPFSISNVENTALSGAVAGAGTIKIYGTGITWFVASGNELTGISVINATNLMRLECANNKLTAINVTQNANLLHLDISNNGFTGINVTSNTKLVTLKCNTNNIGALNLSANPALQILHLRANALTTLNLAKNTALTDLDCGKNALGAFDLNNNTALTRLLCDGNVLDSLHVDSLSSLTTLNCSDNKLKFSTLPLKKAAWTTYIYAPQKPIDIPNSHQLYEIIDVYSESRKDNVFSTYNVVNIGPQAVKGVDFVNFNLGKIIIINKNITELYVEITNTHFPDLSGQNVLKTKNTVISDLKLSMTMTTAKAVGSTISFKLDKLMIEPPVAVKVDFGDNVLHDYTLSTNGSPVLISGTVGASQTISVYGVGIDNVNVSYCELTSLDVSKLSQLGMLQCGANTIPSLDLSKNAELNYLEATNAGLTSLLLHPRISQLYIGSNPGLPALDYTLFPYLWRLDCSYNNISALDISRNPGLDLLYCFKNALTSLDVSKNTSLRHLRCGSNKLSTIDVSMLPDLSEFHCDRTGISSLDVSKNISLQYLYCNTSNIDTLDLTANVNLKSLDMSNTNITSIDLSKNVLLEWFATNNNGFTTLDVSLLPKLKILDISRNQLSFLDISKNTELSGIHANFNNLSGIDVTKNLKLTDIDISNNSLSALDLSNNTLLVNVKCYKNDLSLSSLPPLTIKSYLYSSQHPYVLPKQVLLGQVIDLSSQYSVRGTISVYKWKLTSGTVLVPGVDYTFSGGKTTFLKAQPDSVLCVMTNTSFPELNYVTTYMKIESAAGTTQSIKLDKGWNLVSINVRPADSAIATLFNGLDVWEIKTMDSFWRKGLDNVYNSLTKVTVGAGYLVNMNTAATLTVEGKVLEVPHFQNMELLGWQLIGCPYQTTTSFSKDFNATNCSVIKSFDGFWIPNGTVNSIQNMEPGRGYFFIKK